ncbi:MAG: PQQ-dependent sugar dehydrogenase, partial [Actinomycetota bacterium]
MRGNYSIRPQPQTMRGRRWLALWLPLLCLLAAACSGAPGDGASKGSESRARSAVEDDRPDGGSDGSGQRAPVDLDAIDVALRPVVDGLEAPLGVTHAGDGSGRLFVVEQGGTVRIVRDGRLEPDPWLDLRDETAPGGEQGLLGLAFHPGYERNGRLFV